MPALCWGLVFQEEPGITHLLKVSESLPSGTALPAKQGTRNRNDLKHRESSSRQTLHLLHLKKLLSQPPPRASAPPSAPSHLPHAAPATPPEKWKMEQLCAAPNDQVYEELIESQRHKTAVGVVRY